MRANTFMLLGAALAAATIAALLLTTTAGAAVITVTNTNDEGAGSLRRAIEASNALPGADAVRFDLPGGAPHLISPTRTLPAITDRVTIDGFSQPGSNGIIAILIGLARAPGGLVLETDGSVIRGLDVRGADGAGLSVSGSHNRVEASRFAFNGGAGVRIVDGTSNTIFAVTFANGGLGIDLADTTPPPVRLVGSNTVGSATVVDWRVDGAPDARYRLDFYATDECGEAETRLGSTTVVTDAGGRVNGFTEVAWAAVGRLVNVTATLLDGGGTSELSGCVTIVDGVRR